MSITLFGHPGSTCTRKVLFTLHEKAAPFTFEVVELTRGEHKAPAHLARQPFGVVPAIEHDGFAMYESRAIIRYFDAALPGPTLTPADLHARATMDQWISVESSYFSPPAMKAILNIWYSGMKGASPDPAVIAEGKAGAARALDVLERALTGKEYLVGAFSLAEVCFAPYLQYLFDMGIADIVAERPAVNAWWGRVAARPAWQKAIGKGA